MQFDDRDEYALVSRFLSILQRMGLETGATYRRFWTNPVSTSGKVVIWGLYPYGEEE